MARTALPSLTASVALHLALSLGIGVESLRVSRAPLLPAGAAEFELVPQEFASLSEAPAAVAQQLSTESGSVVARARAPSIAPGAAADVTSEPARSAALAAIDAPNAESSTPPSGTPAESSRSAAFGAAPAGTAASGAGPLSSAGPGAAGAPAGVPALAPSAGGSGTDARAVRAAYLQELRRRVLAHRVYPYSARRARLEGTVCLRVSLNGQGQVARLQATCAAPAPLLEAALAAVRTAAPFGPLPNSVGGELTVDVPMVFQLEAM